MPIYNGVSLTLSLGAGTFSMENSEFPYRVISPSNTHNRMFTVLLKDKWLLLLFSLQ